MNLWFNPLVPDAHYSDRRDSLASLQYSFIEVNDDKLADVYILHPRNYWVK